MLHSATRPAEKMTIIGTRFFAEQFPSTTFDSSSSSIHDKGRTFSVENKKPPVESLPQREGDFVRLKISKISSEEQKRLDRILQATSEDHL